MKRIIFALFLTSLLYSCSPDGAKEYTYSGTIVSHGYEAPTSGYKSSRDAKYYVMMREDSTNQVIRINVTVPTYHNLKDGDRTSFVLSNWDLYYYGNTTDMTKNLYGK
jgi:hypothetical protein